MARRKIRFLLRRRPVEVVPAAPTQTLLDYLRLEEGARGTKEGCGEGDCGACTVALGSVRDGKLVYEPVNACILLLGQADGKEVVTVEDLAHESLHPVQRALVAFHGSQCGFCTPGIVMSLFTLYHQEGSPSRQQVVDQLAGNLCRCTGYRPIVDAALAACVGAPEDGFAQRAAETVQQLSSLQSGEDVFIGDEQGFLALPASPDSLARLYERHPDAVLVAGATDVGLWITKALRILPKIVLLQHAGLDGIADQGDGLKIGATASFAQARPYLASIDPDLDELLRRIGAEQVRACGTIGGNIANGSPIGDSPPALIALGAMLELRQGAATRTMPLEDFFIAYGKQDRKAGEFVASVTVPKLMADQVFRCYKISKRFDQDISAVLGAFRFTLDGARIADARVAFGGMAATPKRALEAEAVLAGALLNEPASRQPAMDALERDYQPIGDHRASAQYRRETAAALLTKALSEISGAGATRLVGMREKPRAA